MKKRVYNRNRFASMCLRKVLLAEILLFLPQSTYAVDTSDNPIDKPVFAHYMVAIPRAGGDATVEDYKSEILDAQSFGIDGFALNCGGWTIERKSPSYKERTKRIYQAAEELGTEFKLFISADFASQLNFGEFVDMVESFRDHPNQFYWDGKPVISTFVGEKHNLTELSESAFTGDREIMLVPFYFPDPPSETPTREQAMLLYERNKKLPGFFLFGAAGTPDDLARSVKDTADVWHEAGKLFMAPVTPYYRGRGGNYRAFETNGFEGMAKAWEAAITSKAEWAEIVTWNDWNECTYVSPIDNFAHKHIGDAVNWLLPHEAYQEAGAYYMEWFKSGEPPDIIEDVFYYFYRLHPKSVAALDGRYPKFVEKLEDRIYATVFLTEESSFTISCGDETKTFELAPGIHHVSIPMAEGTPYFTLVRNGEMLIKKKGEYNISPENNWAWFNYFAGSSNSDE